MNLEGIRRVMELEAENERLRAELEEARRAPGGVGAASSRSASPLAVFGDRRRPPRPHPSAARIRVRGARPAARIRDEHSDGITHSDWIVRWIRGTPGR